MSEASTTPISSPADGTDADGTDADRIGALSMDEQRKVWLLIGIMKYSEEIEQIDPWIH